MSFINSGSLTISDDAQLNFGALGSGSLESGSNTLLTSGARLTSSGLSIRIQENASLVIQDRAVAELWYTAINGAAVQVSDSGTQLTVKSYLQLSGGSAQNGQLQVTDGGRAEISGALNLSGSGGNLAIVDIARTSAGAADATVSAGSLLLDNSDTRLNVSGAGSLLTIAGSLVSSGVTALSAGGKIVADTLNNRIGSTLLADGRGTALTVRNALTSDNILQVTDGATVRAGSLNNSGRVNLSGENTRLEVAGLLTSSDSLVVQNSAALAADSILIRGGNTGLNSTLTLAGRGGTVLSDAVTLASSASSRALVDFAHANTDLRFAPRITGDGDVNVTSGITTLLARNDYRGDTRLSGGALRAGADNVFSAASTYTLNSGTTLDLNGFSQRTGDIVNGGTLNLAGKTAGAVLTVDGNYTSNDGTLIMGTALGGDASVTDRFVVTGDVSGTTKVRVNNLGGRGAATLNGIELIEVQGSADSNAFRQDGRIVAGAYDYRLIRGDRNWYLTNRIDEETGLPIIGGGGGENPGDGGNPGEGGSENPGGGNPGNGSNPGNGDNPGNGGGVIVLRPEGGAYATNLAAASTLFDTRMSDRQGTRYLDPLTGKEQYTSLWLRVSGDHNRLNAGGGQLSTRANSVVTMLGGDVMATDKARLGVMAGYGNSKSNTRSDITGYRAKGQINGYTAGLYGTWFAEGTDEKGLWADSTLQYSWFNNSVDGEDEAGESYKSKGLSASLSTGYVIPLGEGERKVFFLQPQARADWSGIKADDHTERNGTLVQGSGQDNVSSSVGVKAFMKSHAAADSQTGRTFTSFAEANWIHNTKYWGVRMDDVAVTQSGSRNIGEVRVGVDGALGGGFGVKGTIGQQVGDRGWSDTAATLGVSYRF
ncbi:MULTISPECIES: autotransporter outer membrane beta-barrel domain-containing protein [unclassified Pantoea]|uniref:autotransporter outer membrane beta-barrel domain-containing protein n=1 Tax=unclassified Pantoea TaxID=2630326 RepID=UPI0016819077|nr:MULTISPECIES: autotransporter outer membrane beta-barrel domain-containing protein [unclassified Pantoea]